MDDDEYDCGDLGVMVAWETKQRLQRKCNEMARDHLQGSQIKRHPLTNNIA